MLSRIRTLSVPRVLLQSDFNRQKRSLENFSLPLVTLWKRVGTHTQKHTTCDVNVFQKKKKEEMFTNTSMRREKKTELAWFPQKKLLNED